VPAAANRERELVLDGESHCGRDIVDTSTARDRGRALVDHAVPDPARFFVVPVRRAEHVARKALVQKGGGVADCGGG
jgi:hypothetical protein